MLDEKEKPFLQGWAIVENTTEEDWNDVGLTLVSGRPISFVMDLYQPLYVQRPRGEAGAVCVARAGDVWAGSGRGGQGIRRLQRTIASAARRLPWSYAGGQGGAGYGRTGGCLDDSAAR